MAMTFNPYQPKATMSNPVSSQAGINQLLKLQGQSVNDLTGSLGEFGKTSRTNTINDLIARGGLEGLNEAQAQQAIIGQAGGSLTDQGQANVDALLAGKGKQDTRDFKQSEQRQRQDNARNVADKLFGRQVDLTDIKHEDTLEQQKINRDELGKQTFQLVKGADGQTYKVNRAGDVANINVEQAVDSSGKSNAKAWKPQGPLKKMYNQSTQRGQKALEQFWNTGELQAIPQYYTDKNGVEREKGQKLLYKGQPTTIAQLKEFISKGEK